MGLGAKYVLIFSIKGRRGTPESQQLLQPNRRHWTGAVPDLTNHPVYSAELASGQGAQRWGGEGDAHLEVPVSRDSQPVASPTKVL